MRVIVRWQRPHPGTLLRFTDIHGYRYTCFATSTKGGQLAITCRTLFGAAGFDVGASMEPLPKERTHAPPDRGSR